MQRHTCTLILPLTVFRTPTSTPTLALALALALHYVSVCELTHREALGRPAAPLNLGVWLKTPKSLAL
jgi:hypothetical protein